MNPFRDGPNPYESPPIVAELNEPKRPAPPRKPWPPVFALFWVAVGPFLCLWLFRYCYSQHYFTRADDAIYLLFFVTTTALWLIAAARSVNWLIRAAY